MTEIRICRTCGSFSLDIVCAACQEHTASVRPAKFSHNDKYASYRRRALRIEREQRGLL